MFEFLYIRHTYSSMGESRGESCIKSFFWPISLIFDPVYTKLHAYDDNPALKTSVHSNSHLVTSPPAGGRK